MAHGRGGNSGGMCCIRVSLIIFNLITLLAGVATLGIGVWLFHQSHNTESGTEFLEEVSTQENIPNHGEFKGFSIMLIGLGVLVGFISFLGCFGACIKSRCLLLMYLTSVVLILTLQLLVSIFAIVYRQPMSSGIRNELLITVQKNYRPDNPTANTWDHVHHQFQCCGVDGYSDWFGADAWPGQKIVPDSCCWAGNNTNTGCGRTINPTAWHKQGCLGQIQLWILEQLHILASAIITLVFLQLYGIIASTLLFYHTKTPQSPKSFKAYQYERAGM